MYGSLISSFYLLCVGSEIHNMFSNVVIVEEGK